MSENGTAPFKMLNETAIAAAELHRTPFDYCYVNGVMDPSHKGEVLADAPRIAWRGSYALPDLTFGPNFDLMIQDLLSDRFPSPCREEVRHRPQQMSALYRYDGEYDRCLQRGILPPGFKAQDHHRAGRPHSRVAP